MRQPTDGAGAGAALTDVLTEGDGSWTALCRVAEQPLARTSAPTAAQTWASRAAPGRLAGGVDGRAVGRVTPRMTPLRLIALRPDPRPSLLHRATGQWERDRR